jgi:putative peptidoglycan lipid II flippase
VNDAQGPNGTAGALGNGPVRREGGRLTRDSLALAAISILNMGAGFSWDIAIAATFGIGARSDAFYLAYTLPGLITSVVYLSSSSILVPAVVRDLTAGAAGEAWRIFSNVLNLIVLFSCGVGLVGAAASPWLVRALAPGFNQTTADSAAQMSAILFLSLPIAAAFEVIRTGLYARQRYVLPTGLDLLGNLLVTVSIVVASGGGIVVAAWGTLLAKTLQLAVVAPVLWREEGFRYHPSLGLRDPKVWTTCRAFAAPVTGIGARRATILVERVLASRLPAGSITALNYGSKLGFSAATAFFSSVTTALLPRLTSHIKRGARPQVLENLLVSMKLVTFVSVPAVLIIILLREPLVGLLFQRGQVDRNALTLTATVVAIYSCSLLVMGPWRILQNFFYADGTPRTVTGLFLLTAAVNLALDLLLVRFWQAPGIAVATFGSTGLATLVGCVALHRRLGGFPWARLVPFSARIGAAALMSTAAILLAQRLGVLSLRGTGTPWDDLYNVTLASCLGGLAFLAVLALSEPRLLAVLHPRTATAAGRAGGGSKIAGRRPIHRRRDGRNAS